MRAVFFTAQYAGCTVAPTSDQQSEDSAACSNLYLAAALLVPPAWNAAAQTMNGQPFYGLINSAVLPAGLTGRWQKKSLSCWSTAPRRKSPCLCWMCRCPSRTKTPTLYQNLKALEEKQQLHCGLQTLFDNAETAAVPVSAGGRCHAVL